MSAMNMVIKNETQDLQIIKDWVYEKISLDSIKLIGVGSFGEVYQYKDYAIKVFFDEEDYIYINDPENLMPLQKYEGFPKLLDYKSHKYMVTEYLPGCDLNKIKKSEVKIPSNWKNQLNERFDAIINSGMYLVDVDEDNIRIHQNGTLYICDVGLLREPVKFKTLHKTRERWITQIENVISRLNK